MATSFDLITYIRTDVRFCCLERFDSESSELMINYVHQSRFLNQKYSNKILNQATTDEDGPSVHVDDGGNIDGGRGPYVEALFPLFVCATF